jgi:aspartyl-tRNA(Asn)/glutamyl-tRNA(Gln) amidotransferase subunit C
MQIDNTLILHLEKLARLRLQEDERTQLSNDLTDILKMVDKLQEIDTTGVEPLVYLSPVQNVFRADEVRNQLPLSASLSNAPKQDGQFFRVPKVIED